MKKTLFLASLMICMLVYEQANALAQPPQRGRRAPMGEHHEGTNRSQPDKMMLEHFPDIPGISLEQRADIGIILMKEQKEINKLMPKKHHFMERTEHPSLDEKKHSKIQREIEKTNRKIMRTTEKSNKKVKKILSEEQYRIFIEKRSEFRFKRMSPMQFNGKSNEFPQGERPENMRERPRQRIR